MLGGRPLENGMPKYKYYANILLTAFANIIFKRYLTEIHSGFRAYSKKYLETIRFEENSDDFVFDTEIIAQGMANNLFFQEVPIETRYFPEASSINFRRSVIYGFGVLWVLLKYNAHPFSLQIGQTLAPTRPRGVLPPPSAASSSSFSRCGLLIVRLTSDHRPAPMSSAVGQ